jgi:hypothetical protein
MMLNLFWIELWRWLKFIGDRNIKSTEDAQNYIQKIMDNPKINYWAVKSGEEKSVWFHGKRDYPTIMISDLHFFRIIQIKDLPTSSGKVWKELSQDRIIKSYWEQDDNRKSVRLLEKLGLHWVVKLKMREPCFHFIRLNRNKFYFWCLICFRKMFDYFIHKWIVKRKIPDNSARIRKLG